ncbi:MAG: hypothetical protein ACW99Q_11555 [Candidatus Kariarchaeaceae archaeon]|jgi:hypothetical protein
MQNKFTYVGTRNARCLEVDSLVVTGTDMDTSPGANKILQSKDIYGNLKFVTKDSVTSKDLGLTGVSINDINTGVTNMRANNLDESATLQNALDNVNNVLTDLGVTTPIIIDMVADDGYFFFDDSIKLPNNVSLDFKNPCIVTPNVSFKIEGSFRERPTLDSDTPRTLTTIEIGDTTATITDPTDWISAGDTSTNSPNWRVGDIIVLRDNTANTSSKVELTAISANGDNYDITWTPAASNQVPTGLDGEIVRFQQAKSTTDILRGDFEVVVEDYTSGLGVSVIDTISVGDVVMIKQFHKVGDIIANTALNVISTSEKFGDQWAYSNNDMKIFIALVVRKASGTRTLELDLPFPFDMTASDGNIYLIRLSPRQNQFIRGLHCLNIEGATERSNNHLVSIQRGLNCWVENFSFTDIDHTLSSDVTLFGWVDNLMRMRESRNCTFRNCNIYRHSITDATGGDEEDGGEDQSGTADSGESYLMTIYFSTNCQITNSMASFGRHNFLGQGCNYCSISDCRFTGVLISGIDFHGINATHNTVNNCYLSTGPRNSTGGNSTISLIRVGNSFHGVGDSFNTFSNCVLEYGIGANVRDGVYGDTITTYGIEVVPRSSNNVFNNITIKNLDYGIIMRDHTRFRLDAAQLAQNNIFRNIVMQEVSYPVFLNGQEFFDAQGSDYYHTGTFTDDADSTTVLVLPDSVTGSPTGKNPIEYNGFYTGWTITIAGTASNNGVYTISGYVASDTASLHARATITPAMTNTTVNTGTFILQDSTTATILPIRNTLFDNITSINGGNGLLGVDDFDINVISTQQTDFIRTNILDTNANDHCINFNNNTDIQLLDTNMVRCRDFLSATGNTGIRIVNNKMIEATGREMLSDGGTNTDFVWNNNDNFGATTVAWDMAGGSAFTNEISYLGFTATPDQPALVVRSSTGRVGIGSLEPNTELEVDGNIQVTAGNRLRFGDNNNSIRVDNAQGGDGDMKFVVNGNTLFRIRDNGQITLLSDSGEFGNADLLIDGNVRIRGFIDATSFIGEGFRDGVADLLPGL